MRRIVIALVAAFTLGLFVFSGVPAEANDLETAQGHFEQGKWKEAAVAYRKVVDAERANYTAHVLYQVSHARLGADVGELVAYYDGLLARTPDDVDLRLHRVRLKEPAARTRELKALAKSHGTNCSVHVEVARAALAQGDTTQALSALKKAAAIATGGRKDVVLLQAAALAMKGRAKEAAKLLRGAVQSDAQFQDAWIALGRIYLSMGDTKGALESGESARLLRPLSVPAQLLHAQAADAAGDLDTAMKSAGTALRLAPHLPATSTAMGDYVGKQKAEGALERAKALYEDALKLDEEFVGALHGLGWVLERMEQYEQAEKQHRALHAVRNTDPVPANSVGWCLFKRGRISEAQVYFRKAMDLDKHFVPAIANLGMTYDKRKQYSKAIKLYEGILKRRGHQDDLRIILNCAFDHESLGAFRKAVKLLERAHKLRPGDANIMVWLGDDWYFQKKWAKALRWYEQAVGADSKLFQAWVGLGYCNVQLRKWADAANALEKAKDLDESELDLLLILADIYLDELDDEGKALATLQEWAKRGGDEQDILDLIAELQKSVK